MTKALELTASVGEGCANRPEDVIAVKARLTDLGFDWPTPGTVVDAEFIAAIRLFQAIINGDQKVALPHNDGRIDLNGGTHGWLNAVNAPKWKMLSAGAKELGFVNIEVADVTDQHDFGTDWLDSFIEQAGATYQGDYLAGNPKAALITINDASLPHGGNTPDHAGHETGLSCDLRLPQTDGSAGGITWESDIYDRSAARAMLAAFHFQPWFARVYFNDPDLIAEGKCSQQSGHDNHIHVEMAAPSLIL